ncbi:hypothetical protein ONS95_001661 [Cadophora gregata]|uniref:uncharacterized protein n=1 Tax=Cadophora gregata TaxID=51156 RepID=UPI0026DBAE10|nr:uncharacterized protein ONS95_001661 [Cadophora gregata]KAK0111289.1 hypothetical protein ONS95_001661 [Cadophora gregata]
MSPFFFRTLVLTLGVLPTQASWLPQPSSHSILGSRSWTVHKKAGTASGQGGRRFENTTTLYISGPSASITIPTPTSQGKTVTSVVPMYELCDVPGKSTTSCSTAFETVTTESCSTILTYAFTKTTISDCSHNITFSSRTTYALLTTTLTPSEAILPTPVTYIQSIVSLYAAPWQSLAADTPGGITVLICTTDFMGQKACVLIAEVWVVRTEYVPITTTSTFSLSTSFSSDAILLLGPTQSLVVPAGNFTLSTLVQCSTMSPRATTSTVVSTTSQSMSEAGTVLGVNPINDSVQTLNTSVIGTVTGEASTITKTLSLIEDLVKPTKAAILAGVSVEPRNNHSDIDHYPD